MKLSTIIKRTKEFVKNGGTFEYIASDYSKWISESRIQRSYKGYHEMLEFLPNSQRPKAPHFTFDMDMKDLIEYGVFKYSPAQEKTIYDVERHFEYDSEEELEELIQMIKHATIGVNKSLLNLLCYKETTAKINPALFK